MPRGGARPGAGRPPGQGARTALTRKQTSAFIATVAEEAQRAYHTALKRNPALGLPPPKFEPDDLRAAVAYLTRLKLACIAGAMGQRDFKTAIDGIERLEERMVGRVAYVKSPGVGEGEDGAPGAGDRTIVVVLGEGAAQTGLDAFGYKPLPKTIPAKAS